MARRTIFTCDLCGKEADEYVEKNGFAANFDFDQGTVDLEIPVQLTHSIEVTEINIALTVYAGPGGYKDGKEAIDCCRSCLRKITGKMVEGLTVEHTRSLD
jgi:hypothetical protein